MRRPRRTGHRGSFGRQRAAQPSGMARRSRVEARGEVARGTVEADAVAAASVAAGEAAEGLVQRDQPLAADCGVGAESADVVRHHLGTRVGSARVGSRGPGVQMSRGPDVQGSRGPGVG
eukprot:scaffold60060_cov53-Phaeocystis_antarctica.AAC.5